MPNKTELREEAKRYYRDKKNIEIKWLDQYGNISIEGDYQRNRSCLFEVFNMLDVVMENRIDDFRESHAILSIEPDGHSAYYTFETESDRSVRFRRPSSFASRVIALRAIGYDLSDDLFYGTRLLRNETTHGNKTIILQYMQLSYEDTRRAMLSMADALIELGELPARLREPSFDLLRIKEGDVLQSGAYTIGPLIGEGGMSRVYLADQERIGRRFAVKELKPGTYSEDQIRHECEVLSSLHHKHIPHIYDVFYENATYYIVMSFIDGISLEQLVKPNKSEPDKTVSEEERLRISRDLLDILEYLHSSEVNIVFTDLSPDNIIVDKEGHAHRTDFGISTNVKTRQNLRAATLGYSAPEVFSGGILDQRSDIYSLGYVLRYLYTGLEPFDEQHQPTTELISDPRIAETINRCTAKNPDERFAAIAEVKAYLFPEKKHLFSSQKRIIGITGITAAAIVVAALFIHSVVKKNADNTNTENASSVSVSSVQEKENLLKEDISVISEYDDTVSFPDSGLTDHAIEWKDNALEAKMRGITGIEAGEIHLSDIWEIRVLNLEYSNITDISALAECTQLSELYLGHNEISDAAALSSLKNLEYLEMEFNPLSSISSLNSLKNLTWLDLNHCGLSDISTLADLSELKDVELSGNSISDLSSLKGLNKMEYLDISANQITDLSDLSGLLNLRYLNISDNNLSGNLSALESLTELSRLYIQNNHIQDISALANMKHLIVLDVSNNDIGDYSVLDELQVEDLNK